MGGKLYKHSGEGIASILYKASGGNTFFRIPGKNPQNYRASYIRRQALP
jgi:hypothetical protein